MPILLFLFLTMAVLSALSMALPPYFTIADIGSSAAVLLNVVGAGLVWTHLRSRRDAAVL